MRKNSNRKFLRHNRLLQPKTPARLVVLSHMGKHTCARGTHLELRTPPGYGLTQDIRERAAKLAASSGAVVHEQHDLAELPTEFDVVYTTRWQTTGTSKPDPNWRTVFAPFQVTTELMDRFPDAVFMHDLPAHRGEEVVAEVLDGPRSIAFDQAENKMHSAMAVLEWCVAGNGGRCAAPA